MLYNEDNRKSIHDMDTYVKLIIPDGFDRSTLRMERAIPGEIGIVSGYSPVTNNAVVLFPFRTKKLYLYAAIPDGLLEAVSEEEFWTQWESKINIKLSKLYGKNIPKTSKV